MRELLRRLRTLLSNRLVILGLIFSMILYLLWSNLFQLQVLDPKTYAQMETPTYVNTLKTDGTRGEIYDRYGRPLAYNEYTWSLYYDSSQTPEDLNGLCHRMAQVLREHQVSSTLSIAIAYSPSRGFYYQGDYQDSAVLRHLFLAEIYSKSSIQLTAEEKTTTAENAYLYMRDELFQIDSQRYTIEETLEIMEFRYAIYIQRFHAEEPILIASRLPEKLRVSILEKHTEYPGFEVHSAETRVYPEGEAFAHIIGYLGSIPDVSLSDYQARGYDPDAPIGIEGLEAVYESKLRGTQGLVEITYNNMTDAELSRNTVQEATKGSSIYLTIDKDLQKQTYEILVEKIKTLLIDKITGQSSADGSSYTAGDILMALFTNGVLDPDDVLLSDSVHAKLFRSVYESQAHALISSLRTAVTNRTLKIKNYSEDLMQIYNAWIEIMRDAEGVLSSDYQKSGTFYEQYAAGEKTAYEFLEYCIYNNILDLQQFGLEHEMNVDVIIQKFLDDEFSRLADNNAFQEILYGRILDGGLFSEENFMLILYEAGIWKDSGGIYRALQQGAMTAEQALIHKIEMDELTPSDINLDPCSGSAVITDTDTGEVLAMVSYPSYDNNRITSDASYYSRVVSNQSSPLLFRALLETRAPGSTFKMCTAVTSLEEEVVTPEETIYDAYQFELANSIDKPVCHSTVSHGNINIVDALKVSCNYYFYTMGYRLSEPVNEEFDDAVGLRKLAKYAIELGLATKTHIELAEADPSTSIQDAVRSAIGQGTNSYSPANINRYTSTLANDGTVYDLYLVDRITDYKGNVEFQTKPVIDHQADVSQTTFDIVRSGMVAMAQDTQQLVDFMDKGISVAGKTGTAQELNDRPDHALFTGYTNVEDPDVTVTVVIPFGGGSYKAIDTFVRLAEAYYAIEP